MNSKSDDNMFRSKGGPSQLGGRDLECVDATNAMGALIEKQTFRTLIDNSDLDFYPSRSLIEIICWLKNRNISTILKL